MIGLAVRRRTPCAHERARTWMHRARVCAIAGATMLAVAAAGCQGDVEATLVAIRGSCGPDNLELSELSIVPRGDFPTVEPTESHGGETRLPALPPDVAGITVEGRFEDISEAVGRTARLGTGEIPVYFAPIEELCVVQSGIDERQLGAVAVGPEGDVLLAGGRDKRDTLLREIRHTRDDAQDELVAPLPGGMPVATSGFVVVPLGERRFAAIGGARADGHVVDHFVPIDLDASDPVGDPWGISVEGIDAVARAYHAAAVLPNGRAVVSGGCRALDTDYRCEPSAGHVLRTTFAIAPSVEDPTGRPTFQRGPDHIVARYDHQLLASRDGVLFAAGGRSIDGRRVITIERLRPGTFEWEVYGPTQDLDLAADDAITGAALLEGGLLVVTTTQGAIGWVSEHAAGRWWQPGSNTFTWCDGDPETPGCHHDESLGTVPTLEHRRLLALPDERVLADTMLLPVGHVGLGPADAVDISRVRPGQVVEPLDARVGADLLQLADGTVMYAGGRFTETLELALPFLLRFRPDLEGPDERIPDVEDLAPGSFIAHDPAVFYLDSQEPPMMPIESGRERTRIEDDELVLESVSLVQEFPDRWAHVRSFRSASFRFEATLRVDNDGGLVHLVLSHGAVARTSIALGGRIEGVQLGADGVSRSAFTCVGGGIDLTEAQAVRFVVTPEKVVISASGIEIANCPGIGTTPVALGLGVSGSAFLYVSDMRLTRI